MRPLCTWILFHSFVVLVMLENMVDNPHLRIFRDILEIVEPTIGADSEEHPFTTGHSPPAILLTQFLEQNPMHKTSFPAYLFIDGIHVFSKSFDALPSTTIKFSSKKVKNCRDFMTKLSAKLEKNGQPISIPCIYIGTHAGCNIIVAGFADPTLISDDLAFEETFTKGSLNQLFYDNVFLKVLIPAIKASPLTSTYLRYSELVNRVTHGVIWNKDTQTEISIGVSEWPIIGANMDKFRRRFFDEWKWWLYLGLTQVGQSIEIEEHFTTTEALQSIGLNLFPDESKLVLASFHVAVDLYCQVQDAIVVPDKTHFRTTIGASVRSTKLDFYPIFGMGDHPAIRIRNSNTKGLTAVKGHILHAAGHQEAVTATSLKSTFERIMEEVDIPYCQDTLDDISLQYLQTYLATTHVVYPRRYKPHQTAPASSMILNGLQADTLQRLASDFSLWDNILYHIRNGNIPLRLEMVLETRGPDDADLNWPHTCLQLLFESLMQSVYGNEMDLSEGQEVLPGFTTYIMMSAVHIIPSFVGHLEKTISSVYAMLVCPLYDAYSSQNEDTENINERGISDIDSLLTVHLAENLLLYMYDGSIARNKDYSLLSKVYKVKPQYPLRLENVRTVRGKCGRIDLRYLQSNSILQDLPDQYFPYLAYYSDPAAFQRFFLIRQLSLSRSAALVTNSPALAVLYVDSCLVAMRRFQHPILSTRTSDTYKNWLTMENYAKSTGKKKFSSNAEVTINRIKQYFLTPAYFQAVNVIGLVMAMQAGHLDSIGSRGVAVFAEQCGSTIRKHVYRVLLQLALDNRISIFYRLSEEDISKLEHAGHSFKQHDDLRRNGLASVIVKGAELFKEKTERDEPLRLFYSVPSNIVSEVTQDVYQTVIKLGVHRKQTDNFDFTRHPVLPVIFRLWYADLEGDDFFSYTDFINHCAFVLVSTLSNMRDEEHRKLFYVAPHSLHAFAQSRRIRRHIFMLLGLSGRTSGNRIFAPLDENETRDVYRYWFGRTRELEAAVPAARANNCSQLFRDRRLNRFHYTICDATSLRINTEIDPVPFESYTSDSGCLFVPDIYFFTLQQANRSTARHHTTVMRVDPAFRQRRWIAHQDPSVEPKFLPIFMDPMGASIVGKRLHENMPYDGYAEQDGDYIFQTSGRILFNRTSATKVLFSDLINYDAHKLRIHAPELVDETADIITYDNISSLAIRAWDLQVYAETLASSDSERTTDVLSTSPSTAASNDRDSLQTDQSVLNDMVSSTEESQWPYDSQEDGREESSIHDGSFCEYHITDCNHGDIAEDAHTVASPKGFSAAHPTAKKKLRGPQSKYASRIMRRRIFQRQWPALLSGQGRYKPPHEATTQEVCSVQLTDQATIAVTCDDFDITFRGNEDPTGNTTSSSTVRYDLRPTSARHIRHVDANSTSQCSKETCNLENVNDRISRIHCRDFTASVTRSSPTTSHDSRCQSPSEGQQQQEIRVKSVRWGSLANWQVIEMSGLGNCMMESLHLMLKGSAKPTSSRRAHTDRERIETVRRFMKHAVMNASNSADESDWLTYAALNRNMFRLEDGADPQIGSIQRFGVNLDSRSANHMAAQLLTYFLGQDINILFGITSRSGLDWGKLTWKGPVYRGGWFMDYCPQAALGPPFALLTEQHYDHEELITRRWHLLVHNSNYPKFIEQCKEQHNNDPVEMKKLENNPEHYRIGIPLGTYLQEQWNLMDNFPPPEVKQGPNFA